MTRDKIKAKLDAKKKKASKKRAAETGAKFATREEWLVACAAAVRPLFDEQGAPDYPKFRVSCGFPKGGRRAIGEAWTPDSSGDGTAELFVSPELETLVEAGSAGVVDVLVHELIHAVVGNEHGHKGPFRKLAKGIGLEGKMTATVAGNELADKLLHLIAPLGPYPHAQLSRLQITKQGTRMLKVVCPDCDYTLRTTQKWIDVGLPTCCCGAEMEQPE